METFTQNINAGNSYERCVVSMTVTLLEYYSVTNKIDILSSTIEQQIVLLTLWKVNFLWKKFDKRKIKYIVIQKL